MNRQGEKRRLGLPKTLDGMPLLFARIAWITLALTLVVLTTWGLVRAYRDPLLVEMPPLTDLFIDLGLDFQDRKSVV